MSDQLSSFHFFVLPKWFSKPFVLVAYCSSLEWYGMVQLRDNFSYEWNGTFHACFDALSQRCCGLHRVHQIDWSVSAFFEWASCAAAWLCFVCVWYRAFWREEGRKNCFEVKDGKCQNGKKWHLYFFPEKEEKQRRCVPNRKLHHAPFVVVVQAAARKICISTLLPFKKEHWKQYQNQSPVRQWAWLYIPQKSWCSFSTYLFYAINVSIKTIYKTTKKAIFKNPLIKLK